MKRVVRALLGFLIMGAAPAPSDFAFNPRLGAQVPLDAKLQDDTGHAAGLADLMAGKPAILALGYFRCPNLCGLVRADLFNALAGSGLSPQHDYTLLALSIDPSETSADAHVAREKDLQAFGAPEAVQAAHYLTGAEQELSRIEAAVGFRARFDPALKQFLHPAGLVLLTPSGGVSGYLLGLGYQAGDLRAGVVRADSGGVAKSVLPILLLCFHFDPTTGHYTLAVTRVLEIASGLTVLTVGTALGLALRRERRRS